MPVFVPWFWQAPARVCYNRKQMRLGEVEEGNRRWCLPDVPAGGRQFKLLGRVAQPGLDGG